MVVTMQHLRTIPYFGRRPGFCLRGARAWFERHGLDFRAFVREGIDAELLLATGDGMARALVEWARQSEDLAHG
jgi:hypothetical protein